MPVFRHELPDPPASDAIRAIVAGLRSTKHAHRGHRCSRSFEDPLLIASAIATQ
jgi:hypothetical protein